MTQVSATPLLTQTAKEAAPYAFQRTLYALGAMCTAPPGALLVEDQSLKAPRKAQQSNLHIGHTLLPRSGQNPSTMQDSVLSFLSKGPQCAQTDYGSC